MKGLEMNRLIDMLLPNEPGSSSRRFFLSAALWLFVGILLAVIAALQMIAPDLLPADPRLTFGRIRPTHINIVVFGFLCSGFFAGFLYVVPLVCRTTLFSERLANQRFHPVSAANGHRGFVDHNRVVIA